MSFLILFLAIRDVKKMISFSFHKNSKFYFSILLMIIALSGAIIIDMVLIYGIIKFI